jgi:hypothetical protein
MMPVQSVGVPRLLAKGFSTGDLDIVELSMAKKPTRQSIRKMLEVLSFDIVPMHSPKPNHLSRFLTGFKYFAIAFDVAQRGETEKTTKDYCMIGDSALIYMDCHRKPCVDQASRGDEDVWNLRSSLCQHAVIYCDPYQTGWIERRECASKRK